MRYDDGTRARRMLEDVVRAADSIQGPTGIQELAYHIRALYRAHYTHASTPVNEKQTYIVISLIYAQARLPRRTV